MVIGVGLDPKLRIRGCSTNLFIDREIADLTANARRNELLAHTLNLSAASRGEQQLHILHRKKHSIAT